MLQIKKRKKKNTDRLKQKDEILAGKKMKIKLTIEI